MERFQDQNSTSIIVNFPCMFLHSLYIIVYYLYMLRHSPSIIDNYVCMFLNYSLIIDYTLPVFLHFFIHYSFIIIPHSLFQLLPSTLLKAC